jgi:hypothetical protein
MLTLTVAPTFLRSQHFQQLQHSQTQLDEKVDEKIHQIYEQQMAMATATADPNVGPGPSIKRKPRATANENTNANITAIYQWMNATLKDLDLKREFGINREHANRSKVNHTIETVELSGQPSVSNLDSRLYSGDYRNVLKENVIARQGRIGLELKADGSFGYCG